MLTSCFIALLTCLMASAFDKAFQERISRRAVIMRQDDLIYYCGYSSESPNPNRVFTPLSNEPQAISAEFAFDRFDNINDRDETFSIAGNLYFRWTTYCWSEELFILNNITSGGGEGGTRVFARDWADMYKPRMRLRNSVEDSGMIDHFNIYLQMLVRNLNPPDQLRIDHQWTIYGRFEATCPVSLAKFPFDTQRCALDFTAHSAVSNITDAKLQVGFLGSKPVTDKAAWLLVNTAVELIPANGSAPPQVFYNFTFKRRPAYYVYNMLLPCCVLTVLEFMAFLIPPKLPDRFTYCVTVVLSLSFMLSLVLGTIPQTPQRIFLTDYILAEALLCTLCTLESIVVCRLIRDHPEKATSTLRKQDEDAFERGFTWLMSLPLHRLIDLISFCVVFFFFACLNIYAVQLVATDE